MSWVVLGAGGLVGRHLRAALVGEEVRALSRLHCDVTCAREVERAVAGARVVLNAAAWTDVDGAEQAPEACHFVNIRGAATVARATARAGALLVHLSTDFVFDGDGAPYAPHATPRPLSVYGQSKRAGELAAQGAGGRVLVVRLQALYGDGGRNFASRLPALLQRSEAPLRIDDERLVQPTWAHVAAQHTLALAAADATGVFHVAAGGATTWAGFARALAEHVGLPARFEPVSTASLGAAAQRPRDSRFDTAALTAVGVARPADWREGLARYAATLGAAPAGAQP